MDSLQGIVAGCYVPVACKISQGWKCDRIEKPTLREDEVFHLRSCCCFHKSYCQSYLTAVPVCASVSRLSKTAPCSPPPPHPPTHSLYPLLSLSPLPSLSAPPHFDIFCLSPCLSLCLCLSCHCLSLCLSLSLLKRSSSAFYVSLSASPLPVSVCLTLCVSLCVSVCLTISLSFSLIDNRAGLCGFMLSHCPCSLPFKFFR